MKNHLYVHTYTHCKYIIILNNIHDLGVFFLVIFEIKRGRGNEKIE